MLNSPSLRLVRLRLPQQIGSVRGNSSSRPRFAVAKEMFSMSLSPQNVPQKFKRKSPLLLLCRICGKPVAVETAKTDGDGKAIHEDCYVLKVKLEQASKEGHGS